MKSLILVGRHWKAVGTALALALSVVHVGCGSDDDDKPDRPLTDGDADACEQDCDRQVAAGCANLPPNYAEDCKAICEGGRTNTPAECQNELRAIYQCAVDFVSYSCVNDLPRASPSGACAPEAQACYECAGTLCGIPL